MIFYISFQIGIQKIQKRKNELKRPAIANVDQAIIVMSCKDPDFSTTLIDRLIFQIAYANITPILCITKLDLIREIKNDIEKYFSDWVTFSEDYAYAEEEAEAQEIYQKREKMLKKKLAALEAALQKYTE